MGYIEKSWLPHAKKMYKYMVKQFIQEDETGSICGKSCCKAISLTRCCEVGGLGGKNNRMGDYKYYLSEPIRDNDSKGTGPFIWASLEMEKLK